MGVSDENRRANKIQRLTDINTEDAGRQELLEMVYDLESGGARACDMTDLELDSALMGQVVCARCGRVLPERRIEYHDEPESELRDLLELGCADPGDCQCTKEELEAFARERRAGNG